MKKSEQEEIELNLREFKMSWIKENKILVFIGKRNTGKSVLVVDYLYYNQDVPFCTCISPTDDLNLTFRPHIPSRFIFDTYTSELIAMFVKRQRSLSIKRKNALEGRGDPQYQNVDARGILIMDDLLADGAKWKKDENIKWIFMNGRHANITLILTMQYQMGIPPDLRANIDYVFICKETKRLELDKLWRNYAGVFTTFDMFLQVLNQVTQDYGCMVIDNTSNSSKLEDQVFIYKASLHDKNSFKVCYADFWQNNEDYINMDYDDYPMKKPGMNGSDFKQIFDQRQKYKFTINKC